MEEIKRNDLIFFRNDILQDIKNLEININEKISTLTTNLQNFNLLNDQKYEYYKDKYNEILSKADTSEFQSKIKEKMEKFGKKFEELTINNNVKIQKMEKDLADSCYKYDKIYLKNMSSPGLIGDGCPYPTMKSFFVYVDKKIKEMIRLSNKTFGDFNSLKIYLDKHLEVFDKHIEGKELEIYKNMDEKLIQFEKKIDEKKKYLEDRFEYIRLDNSKYIYNIIRNQEIINDKLKLELKKYSVINETLIKHYNAQSKLLNNTNKIESHYSYLFSKSSKKINKKKSFNINELLPTLKKIEEDYNLNNALKKNQDIKGINDLKIKLDDNNLETKNQTIDSITTNYLKPKKNLLLRRSTVIGRFNFNSNLFYQNYNMYPEDNNLKTIFHSNKENNFKNRFKSYKTEEKDNSNSKININEFNTAKSEKKMFFGKINDYNNDIYPEQTKKNNNLRKENNKLEIILNKENNNIYHHPNNKKHSLTLSYSKLESILTRDNINNNENLKPKINNIKLKEINEEKNEIEKKKIIEKIENMEKKIENLEEKEKMNEKEVKEQKVIKEEKKDKKEKERKNLSNILEINKEYKNEKNDKDINYKTISYLIKDENININKIKDMNKNIDINVDKKINRIYKFIEKNNHEINQKYDILSKQIYYLFKEIGKLTKNRHKDKYKNHLLFNSKTATNSSFENNVKLNNLYISSNSIIPLKTSEKFIGSFGRSENSNSFNSSDNKYIKAINNNRVRAYSKNNDNNDNDIENYCFLINKIEPYLIKKFQNN